MQIGLSSKVDTAFSLVMQRGFTLAQASALLGIEAAQIAMELRAGFKEICKK